LVFFRDLFFGSQIDYHPYKDVKEKWPSSLERFSQIGAINKNMKVQNF
jgi:hypothetical protein